MHKLCTLLLFVAILCSATTKAQKMQSVPRASYDSIEMMYNAAIVVLDSVMGTNIELQKQLKEQETRIKNLTLNLTNELKKRNELMQQLKSLEAEVKRLQGTKAPAKKN